MLNVKAQLNNYHQTPRKVRLLADLVRGQLVTAALDQLRFLPKRAALPLSKLIQSAAANAINKEPQVRRDDLYIKRITVGKGMVSKRFRAGARGRAFPIKRQTSHISVELKNKNEK